LHHHAVGIDGLLLVTQKLVQLARSGDALLARMLTHLVRLKVVYVGPREVADQDHVRLGFCPGLQPDAAAHPGTTVLNQGYVVAHAGAEMKSI